MTREALEEEVLGPETLMVPCIDPRPVLVSRAQRRGGTAVGPTSEGCVTPRSCHSMEAVRPHPVWRTGDTGMRPE